MGWQGLHLKDGYMLWSNNSTTEGAYVQKWTKRGGVEEPDGPEITIPSWVFHRLVANEIRNHRVSELEQMDDDVLLGLHADKGSTDGSSDRGSDVR